MRKMLAFIGIAALTVSLAACGSQAQPAATSSQASSAPAASADAPQTVGGWTLPESVEGTMSNEAGEAFEKAAKEYKDEELTGIRELGSQIVAGTNYMMLCENGDRSQWKVAVVYADLEGNAEITNVTVFDLGKYAQDDSGKSGEQGLAGGWTVFQDPSGEPAELPKEVSEAFDKAMEGLTGADYKPVLYMGSQLVNGFNYAVLCEQTTVTADPQTNLAVVYIYAPATGEPEIMNIYPLDLAEFTK